MAKSGALSVVALVAFLIVQTVSCANDELEEMMQWEAMQWEAKGLEYDKLIFRDLRVEDILQRTQCQNIRNRRKAYELFRNLEHKREQAIRKLLAKPKEGLTLDEFRAELRKINSAALEDVTPIHKQMKLACSYPEEYNYIGRIAVSGLKAYLKSRISGNEDKMSVADYQNDDVYEDTWDQGEVDLESDKDGAKAVAEAIKNEEAALKNDDQQLEYMAEDYGDAATTIENWGNERRAAIRSVLRMEFTSPKEFRRELHKVHKQQLAKLEKLDHQIEDELDEEEHRNFVYWADNLFFERMVAVIKGKDWRKHKKSADVSSDMVNLLDDKAI